MPTDDSTRNVDRKSRSSIGGRVLNLYKQPGETPLERLERLRAQKPEYAHEVLSYAGRLDPLAEGVLLALAGAANARREEYLNLDKEYIVDVLFGFSTDTYDLLGKVMESGDAIGISRVRIEEGINEFRGETDQAYPPYSSKTVEGRPLFSLARESDIYRIELPRKLVKIYSIYISGLYKIRESLLIEYISSSIGRVVSGDFRQEETLRLWQRHLSAHAGREFPCVTLKISCSSGTYARSLAYNLGLSLGVPALALHILRTRVGDYVIEKALR